LKEQAKQSKSSPYTKFVCPGCRSGLSRESNGLACDSCGVLYPISNDSADFSQGDYYDQFDPNAGAAEHHLAGLEAEYAGVRARIEDFYLPLIRDTFKARNNPEILDCGCGNGLSVDLLNDAGFSAWGNDVSALRKWQWREREHRERLFVTDGSSLPFDDSSIDVVISSGVLEHVGVDEHRNGGYHVQPRAGQFDERRQFIAELVRVVRPRGHIWLDFPNGSFPIDFWHGDRPGGARWHSPKEKFLPTFLEIRGLVSSIAPGWKVSALSPRGRLQFKQVGKHWYGRALRAPAAFLLYIMGVSGLRWMARSPLNPYLVLELTPRDS
jgi:SAM-dependent methyltransferase